MTNRIEGFRGEFLWECEIAERQLVAIAEYVPAELYGWRPVGDARSFREVFVHVATGAFMLLDIVGVAPPSDLYGGLPTEGPERFESFIRRNDELVAGPREKNLVVDMLKRALRSLSESFMRASDDDLNRRLIFFGEETTVRRAYMRLLAHTDEHMGQIIAYARFNGMAVPWPDWRPDRRTGGAGG